MYKSSDKLINNIVNNIQLFHVLSCNRPDYFSQGNGNLIVHLLAIPLTPGRIINMIVHLLASPLPPERIIDLIVHLPAIPLTPERIIKGKLHGLNKLA